MKKILALALAALMLIGMMSVAFADTFDGDTPIKVTGLAEGDTAHFYQVLKWVGVTGDEAAGNVAGWKAVSPFDTLLTQSKLTEVLVGTKATETEPKKDPTGITAELAGDLARLATGTGNTVAVGATGEAVLNNAEAGMWMALITPTDANTIYSPVFVSADFDKTNEAGNVAVSDAASYSDSAAAKKSTVTLTKTADNASDYTPDHAKTTAIGDVVTFTVTTTIPGYGEVYENPHFALKDTLTDLALEKKTGTDAWDITVSGTGVDADDYTVDATTAGYTITFTGDFLKANKVATEITVVYKAKVTTTAAKAINEEDNDVYIEYSHTPTNENDWDVKKDTTQHYTFTLDAAGMGYGQSVSGKKTSELVKVGRDAAGNPVYKKTETSEVTDTEKWEGPLEGAQFGLWKKDDPTCEGTPYLTASTDAQGRMTFTGLDAGTYYLKEIQAPAGYVTNSTVHTVEINATLKSVKVTEWFKDNAWSSTDNGGKKVEYDTDILESYVVKVDNVEAANYQFKNPSERNSNEINWEEAECVEKPHQFENIQGIELPHTGGMGTTLLYVGGSILVLAAVILLVTKRRMGAND